MDWFAKVAPTTSPFPLAGAPFFDEADGVGIDGVLCYQEKLHTDLDDCISYTWDIVVGIRPPVVTMSKYCRREILNDLLATRSSLAVNVLETAAMVAAATMPMAPQPVISPFAFSLASPAHAILAAYTTTLTAAPFYDAPGALIFAQLDHMYGLLPVALPKVFLDMCWGAGGFSEYLAWRGARGLLVRCQPHALKSTADWPNEAIRSNTTCHPPILDLLSADTALDQVQEQLSAFLSPPMELEGDDKKRNMDATTPPALVSLVVSDVYSLVKTIPPTSTAYFSEQNFQMHLLGGILIALNTLHQGGALVLRYGDAATRFGASLLYVLHVSFATIRIVKPFTSPTFENDRTVVCQGFLGPRATLLSHLDAVQTKARELMLHSGAAIFNDQSVLSFVAITDLMRQDFLRFLTGANERLALREIAALRLLGGFFTCPPDQSGNYPLYDPALVGARGLERLKVTES